MNRILYLEGSGGISGDMTVAALLDLGGDLEKLGGVLRSLKLDGFDYAVARGSSYGLSGRRFEVKLEHPHEHGGHEHSHHHEHRNLVDVCRVIDRGEMTERARDLAKKIFGIVAEAEAEAHGCEVGEVHFHEVGAIDSIVDIVAAAVLIDDLAPDGCVVTGLNEGSGFVRCQHGELPVPVPAVLNIARKYGIPLRPTAVSGEMITPTGIAIAAAVRTMEQLPAQFKVDKVGTGLGTRDFGRANLLRIMLISAVAPPEQIYVIECNIDDSTGEELGCAMESLMAAGALDVHFVPCFMKKNRPAYLLRIVAAAERLPEIEQVVFSATTTIGLRKYPVDRSCMAREMIAVELPFGRVLVKRCRAGEVVRCYPEYESVKQAASEAGLEFRTVFEQAKQAAEAL